VSRGTDAVRALASMDTRDRELTRACAGLIPGKHGPDQPRWIIRGAFLRALDAAGLASYTEKGGWRLTDAGKRRKADFLAAGRAARAAIAGRV
jgi:hypothetical protein